MFWSGSRGSDALRMAGTAVTVEVFRPPRRGVDPSVALTLEAPTAIGGLAVASLPDLLASKLDLLLYRQKLRDYIDVAAIDAHRPYTIEDGLFFHGARYRSGDYGVRCPDDGLPSPSCPTWRPAARRR